MITSIDGDTLLRAAAYVRECTKHADVHTVNLSINGQHGGVDVKIEGLSIPDHDMNTHDYERTYRI